MTPNVMGRGPENASLSTFLADKSQMLLVLAMLAVARLPLFNENNQDDIPCS
jgi:hypothetical protein